MTDYMTEATGAATDPTTESTTHPTTSDTGQAVHETAGDTADSPTVAVALLSGGVSSPSSTRMLVDRLGGGVHQAFTSEGYAVSTTAIELAPLATDLATALLGGLTSPSLRRAFDALADADVVVAGAPIYKAGISGLFKSFLDVLDNDLLVGKTVLLAATAGSPRHALVVDDHLRPLFAFMRAVTAPTSVFAAPEDWADPLLMRRLQRAGHEAMAIHRAGLAEEVSGRSWDSYQHAFDSVQQRRNDRGTDPVFDTALMRLAAGGS
jgi:FMN reductase